MKRTGIASLVLLIVLGALPAAVSAQAPLRVAYDVSGQLYDGAYIELVAPASDVPGETCWDTDCDEEWPAYYTGETCGGSRVVSIETLAERGLSAGYYEVTSYDTQTNCMKIRACTP